MPSAKDRMTTAVTIGVANTERTQPRPVGHDKPEEQNKDLLH
jgi:hypothetical protein